MSTSAQGGRSDRLRSLAEAILPRAPRAPGVYLMKDESGKVFYIGKAKDLRARLRSYLTPLSSDPRPFVSWLADILHAVDFSLTANEKEALILEKELVKRYQPRFNIKLRDDKNFLHLRVRTERDFPRIEVVRRRGDDGARYFGPYDSARSIRDTLRIVNRHFGLRTCSDTDFRARTRPCLEHQIGRCPAPCVLPVPVADYERSVRDALLFLEGRPRALLRGLRQRMEQASARTAFEQAARHRDQILAIERSLVRQDVVLDRPEDIDVVALVGEGRRAVFEVARFRDGYPLGTRSHPAPVTALDEPGAAMASFLHQLYDRLQRAPPLVLVNVDPEMAGALEEILSAGARRRVGLRRPRRGRKRALVAAAERNGLQRLSASAEEHRRRMDVLARLQHRLHLRSFPQRIECFDISNIQGSDPVGSMVVFADGAPDPAGYRKFAIRTVEGIDDFAMMAEMLGRRFRQGESLGPMPDLVVLDGGRSHLLAVRRALEGREDFDLVALAKERLESRLGVRGSAAPGPADPLARRPERVYLPEAKDPIRLRPGDPVRNLLAWIRDEAHRFAITFHRQRRRKRIVRSRLDAVPGIGPKRRAALLRAFGSVDALRGRSAEEIAARTKIPLAVARAAREILEAGGGSGEEG